MSSFHVHIIITTGYLENYGQDKQEIILLHVYNSIDHVTQYSDDDSEGEIHSFRTDTLVVTQHLCSSCVTIVINKDLTFLVQC